MLPSPSAVCQDFKHQVKTLNTMMFVNASNVEVVSGLYGVYKRARVSPWVSAGQTKHVSRKVYCSPTIGLYVCSVGELAEQLFWSLSSKSDVVVIWTLTLYRYSTYVHTYVPRILAICAISKLCCAICESFQLQSCTLDTRASPPLNQVGCWVVR